MPPPIAEYYPLHSISRISIKKLKKELNQKKTEDKLNDILNEVMKNTTTYCKHIKVAKNTNFIFYILDKIIPDTYFGSKINRKVFYSTVKKIINRSCNEYIHLRELYRKYDCESITWMREDCNKKTLQKLGRTNRWLLESIVKPLINHYFYPMKDIDSRFGLIMVPKRKWFSFQTKVLNHMIKQKHLLPVELLETQVDVRGRLKIVMKNGINDSKSYRPIVVFRKSKINMQLRHASNVVLQAISKSDTFLQKNGSLYEEWKAFLRKIGERDIYGVKVDVKDAFGNVPIETICKLLDILVEQKKLPEKTADFIKKHIHNQYVIYKKTKKWSYIGKWNRGLLQGDPLSSTLCHMYLSYRDRLFLQEFCDDYSLVHRTVDDYFYCSISKEKAMRFITDVHRCSVINKDKIKHNFSDNENPIPYCRKYFLLGTKEVKCQYDFKKGCQIKNRCKLWNPQVQISPSAPELLVKRALNFNWNNYYFTKVFINTVYNSKVTVLDNFFEGILYIAFKFNAAVLAFFNEKMSYAAIFNVILSIVEKYSARSINVLQKNAHQKDLKVPWDLYFKKVGFQAFILVLRKKHQFYQPILQDLKKIYNETIIPGKMQVNIHRYKKLPETFQNIRR